MVFDFSGKTIAITGAGSGIGFCTATILWSQGASLAACDIKQAGLDRLTLTLEERPGQKLTTCVTDVTKSDQVNAWFEQAIKNHGRVHGAANIAGGSTVGKLIHEVPDEEYDWNMDLNLRHTFNCMRAQLTHMIEHTSGAIVNTSSMAGLRGSPGTPIYSGAKAGIDGLTRSTALEYGPYGVRVNSVAPGFTITESTLGPGGDFLRDRIVPLTPLKKLGRAEDIGYFIMYLLSDEAGHITGVTTPIDGGMFC